MKTTTNNYYYILSLRLLHMSYKHLVGKGGGLQMKTRSLEMINFVRELELAEMWELQSLIAAKVRNCSHGRRTNSLVVRLRSLRHNIVDDNDHYITQFKQMGALN